MDDDETAPRMQAASALFLFCFGWEAEDLRGVPSFGLKVSSFIFEGNLMLRVQASLGRPARGLHAPHDAAARQSA